jgi:hypothetical protein
MHADDLVSLARRRRRRSIERCVVVLVLLGVAVDTATPVGATTIDRTASLFLSHACGNFFEPICPKCQLSPSLPPATTPLPVPLRIR